MSGNSTPQRKAQLDKAEREHLEDIVAGMRERVEDNVRFQLTQSDLDTRPNDDETLDDETEQLVEAIELEAVDNTEWGEAFEEYVDGVGYTIVNRLAALRCMEVRDFIDEEVTVFKENGLTPAAETLVHEEFLLEDEAILAAYHNTCDELAAEIEILFDRSSAYSLVDPDDDTFEELCRILDEVSEEVWRADDVLGWVYEYYNHANLGEIRKRAHSGGGLRTNDIASANQFYTPHWVVRMITDNSLGKLYLEQTGELQDVVNDQKALSSTERKNRPLSLEESPDIADFCTYLVPSEEEGKPTNYNHPKEIRIIDPACGSGHFLLYGFDILERIWRAETDLSGDKIAEQIIRHNLYGVDLDMRACQLAAFNLYLKGRGRAESEGSDTFDMPEAGIVCADADIADMSAVEEVFMEVSDGREDVEEALSEILNAFEEVQGLGSLLDVRGTLGELFEGEENRQLTFAQNFQGDHSLSSMLHSLREVISEHTDGDSLLAKDLQSFIRLLDILAQDYDVALMNPPYGSGKRMPKQIQQYIDEHYRYYKEFYINFFEVCESLVKDNGRIGMLVPWTLMFKRSFQDFREDFIGSEGTFDFLAEYGYGVLDNATVGTVGTVVRTTDSTNTEGEFIRLHDISKGQKEHMFSKVLSKEHDKVNRYYKINLEEFASIPGTPIMYSIPAEVRQLHDTKKKIDPERADIEAKGIADAVQGLATGNNDRFVRKHWEVSGGEFRPYAKGGTEAYILPQLVTAIDWTDNGKVLKRAQGSVIRNEDFYMNDGLTWSYIKRTGRRFGYVPGSVFDVTGSMLFPENEYSPWLLLCVLNSTIYHGLFLSITPERDWQIEIVGRIPWHDKLGQVDELEHIAKQQYAAFASQKSGDPKHPNYTAPPLAPSSEDELFYDGEAHITRYDVETTLATIEPDQSILEAAREVERWQRQTQKEIEQLSDRADMLIADTLNLPDGINDKLRTEIFLRTSEDPEDRQIPSPSDVPEQPDSLESYVKDLVHHFAMEVVLESDHGIVPTVSVNNHLDMVDRIVEEFEDVYGSYATDRLVEVDDILGNESAEDEAYPNLRRFVDEEFFQYHVERMERTPIIWKMTTNRLVADSSEAGFACFVDYKRVTGSLFDRLTTQYIEPRKAELRERRSAANRRRSDDTLSASEKAAAVERYNRCESGLEQIAVFEDRLADLAQTTPLEWPDEVQQTAQEAIEPVAAFREQTASRLETLEELAALNDVDMGELFSPSFYKIVQENQDEWLDALADLETALDTYAANAPEPVEAQLYDLFEYYDDLIGSTHYASNGILFMTYYFDKFEDADQAQIGDGGVSKRQRLCSELASDLEEYKELADKISEACDVLSKATSSDWSDRALSEITATGYDPNHKHGVEINITPLAEAEIVPKTVDDKVL